jgi:hypothetical protein
MSMMPNSVLTTPTPPTRPARGEIPGWDGVHPEVRRVLEAPFNPDQIRKDVKRHTDGWEMTYVEAHDVIERLNAAFSSAWDFVIVNTQVCGPQVVVHGRLSVGYWMKDPAGAWHRAVIVKEQFGSCFLKMKGNVYVDIGSDYKAAATDAMKKCATQFGIALQLYSRDESAPQGMTRTGNLPTHGSYPPTQANPNDVALPFQIESVKKMFASLGIGDPQWWQALGFASADQITQGHVTALMAGQHPWVQELMTKAGKAPGLTSSAA